MIQAPALTEDNAKSYGCKSDPIVGKLMPYEDAVEAVKRSTGRTIFIHIGSQMNIGPMPSQDNEHVFTSLLEVTKRTALRFLKDVAPSLQRIGHIHVAQSSRCLFIGTSPRGR